MKQTLIWITISFLLLGSGKLAAQDESFKALFIYNFTRLLEWPSDYRQGNFIISVYGDSPMQSAIASMAQEKGSVNNQKIEVMKINSIAALGKSHILYIPSNKSGELGSILAGLGGAKVLIVTDGEGLVKQGSSISFIKEAGVLKFEISKGNIEKNGMKVNNDLLSLGVQVN